MVKLEVSKKRVCVIGAGPSGLLTLRGLDKTLDKEQFEIVCFERYGNLGGQWGHQYKEGLEKDGIESHSGMYANLISNVPREIMEVPEFPFHCSKRNPKPSYDGGESCYVSREQFVDYLDEFAETFNLKNFIRFNRYIENVSFDDTLEEFTVVYKEMKGRPDEKVSKETFNYVIVASGHFSHPNDVIYPGQKTFTGTVLHSKEFVKATKYKGQRVLVVGSSFSSEDIAIKSFEAGASRVTLCCRKAPPPLKFHPDIIRKPILSEISGDTITFEDGTSDKFDVIVYCTGYVHKFPFMDNELSLRTSNRLAQPLYKGVVFPQNRQLFYIGMQNQVYAFPMFWLQGLLSAQFISGKVQIPSQAGIDEEIKTESDRESEQVKDVFDMIDFQTRYLDDLSRLTGEASVDASDLFKQWVADRGEDIMNYKLKSHFHSRFNQKPTELS